MDIIQNLSKSYPEYSEIYIDNIVLYKAEYYIIINLSSKKVYNETQKEEIRTHFSKIIPQSFKIKQINYSKLYCDEEIAISEIKKVLTADFPALNSTLMQIKCVFVDNQYNITLDCDENFKSYAEKNFISEKLSTILTEKFKDRFFTKINYFAQQVDDSKQDKKEDTYKIECQPGSERFIEVLNITPLVGSAVNNPAVYIADCEKESLQTVICGKVKNFSQRQTKNNKTLVSFTLEDFTGKIYCIMFPSAANFVKVTKLEEDSEIIMQGELKKDTYRNSIVFMVRYISYCELPEKFVLKERPSKPEPENYSVIIPQKLELSSQVNIFDATSKISDFFIGKKFCVFDIETTGLNYDIDKITEIGAILIEDGKITQSFSTLINPFIHIREETVKLNGIDDELVKNSPSIEDVLPDFYKFTRGSLLVAQNIDFDLKFIKFNSKKIGYFFENCFYDTLDIARKKLAGKGLSNFKLDTLCSYFNIDLTDHHRAWNDALATAKLFIMLVNLDESETAM